MDLKLSGGLSAKELSEFHEKVLDIIANCGIFLKHKGFLSRLADYDGVNVRGDVVTFTPELVNKYVFNIKYDLPPHFDGDKFLTISGGNNLRTKDIETGKIRLANSDDLINYTKLEDALGMAGSACVKPIDMPDYLQEINMYKILWENSRFKANDIFDINSKSTANCCEYVYEMAQILKKKFTVGVWVQSPRMLNTADMDIVYPYLDKADVSLYVGNYPIYGVSTPLFVESGLALAAAELFSGYLVLRLASGKENVYLQPVDAIMGHPFNWKHGNVVYSSPQDITKTIYQSCLNNYYNIPVVGMSLVTMGKDADCQAGFEKGVHTLIAALLGAKIFRVAGILAFDDYYCPLQLVIDFEIVRMIETLVRRRDFDVGKILLDEIAEVNPGGTFLEKDSTIMNFKKDYYESQIFDNQSFGRWEQEGSKALSDKCRLFIKKTIESHQFELSSEKKKELNAIYQRAVNDQSLIESYKKIYSKG